MTPTLGLGRNKGIPKLPLGFCCNSNTVKQTKFPTNRHTDQITTVYKRKPLKKNLKSTKTSPKKKMVGEGNIFVSEPKTQCQTTYYLQPKIDLEGMSSVQTVRRRLSNFEICFDAPEGQSQPTQRQLEHR